MSLLALTITLVQAIQTALQQNPGFQAATADLRAQEAQYAAVRAEFAFLPVLQLSWQEPSGGAHSAEGALRVSRKTLIGWQWTTALTYSRVSPLGEATDWLLRLEVPFGAEGGFLARLPLLRARLQLAIQQIQYENARQDLILRVVRAYLRAWLAEQDVRIREQILEQARLAWEGDQLRYELGLISEPDRARSELNYLNATVGLLAARRALRDAQQQLAVLLGYPPETEIQPAGEEISLPEPPDWETIRSTAEQRNRDLLALRLQEQLFRWRIQEARRALQPQWNTVLAYSRRSRPGQRWPLPDWQIEAGLSLLLPLRQPREKALLEAAEWNYRAFLERKRETEYAIFQALEQTWRAIQELRERVQILEKSLETARTSFRLIEEAYREGIQGFLDFQIAQQQLAQAELQYLRARVELTENLMQIYKDMGEDLLSLIAQ